MSPEQITLASAKRAFAVLARRHKRLAPRDRARLVRDFGQPSRVSKMPGACSPSLPPTSCPTGVKYQKIAGTPCSSCYAERLRKAYPSAGRRWTQNLRTLRRALKDPEARVRWIDAGAQLLRDEAARAGDPRVRWHVAGDIQSPEHLEMILAVVRATPELLHRLPTQEGPLMAHLARTGRLQLPSNLKLTISLPRLNMARPAAPWIATSNVWTREHLEQTQPDGRVCPAVLNHTPCNSCSACWPILGDAEDHVIYPQH